MTSEVETVPEFSRTDRMALALRHARLTNQDMADYLGVQRETVSRWVNGRSTPGLAVLRLWAMRTQVPLEWLETGEVRHQGLEPRTRCLTALAGRTANAA